MSLRSEPQVDGLYVHCCVGGGACRRDMASGGWFHLSLTPQEKSTQCPLCPSGDLRCPFWGAPVYTSWGGTPSRRKGCGCLMPPASPHLTAASLCSHRPQSGKKGLAHYASFPRSPSPSAQQGVQMEPLSSPSPPTAPGWPRTAPLGRIHWVHGHSCRPPLSC